MIHLGLGHVYHARHDGIRNAFRYPTFFVLFNYDQLKVLNKIFRSRFLRVLGFNSADYLHGASIRTFLQDRCGYEAQEVWLHTMPRMFGYVFNPVSFWLCRKDERLDAVLCEVNNTFGEKHFYWLKIPLGGDSWLETNKEFHVSPFLPVQGKYKFKFLVDNQRARIDVNYYEDGKNLSLSTWVEGDLLDIGQVSLAKILLRYGWMTPLVVFRIHFQALRLWWRRATFYRKPELPKQEVSQ